LSVGTEYIEDMWSWTEILSIIFMFMAAEAMYNKDQDYEKQGDTEILKSFYVKGVIIVTILLVTMQLIIYLRSTLLPFTRFVDGFLTIIRCLIPFTIVTVLIVVFFIYSYWIKQECDFGEDISCDFGPALETYEIFVSQGDLTPSPTPSALSDYKKFNQCAQTALTDLFNYQGVPKREPDDSKYIEWLRYFFGYFVIIVLLNVVIAIVVEAWQTATDRATTLFWKFRLEKVIELHYARKLEPSFSKQLNLLQTIDNVESIQFQNDISWTKPPFDVMNMKAHYEKPFEYFDNDLATKIYKSKSMQGELYWTGTDLAGKDQSFTICHKFIIIFKWLGDCIFYFFLIIIGIFTFGATWPKRFRCGVLSLGRKHESLVNIAN